MRAFVLTGGGNLGAVQVGMLAALQAQGIVPDLVVGTSVGALNAAQVASGGLTAEATERLVRVWTSVRRRDVFPMSPARGASAMVGRAPSLCSAEPLRRTIRAHLPFDRLEDTAIPLRVVATSLLTGQAVRLGTGAAEPALAASAAIPGIFPPVVLDGVTLVDGMVADSGGLACAVAEGADEVWVLPAGYSCALTAPPRSALAVALQSLGLTTHQRLVSEIDRYSPTVELRVAPPLCPVSVSPLDFGRADALVERARRSTEEWLDAGAGPVGLGVHRHPARAPRTPARSRASDSESWTSSPEGSGWSSRPGGTPGDSGSPTGPPERSAS